MANSDQVNMAFTFTEIGAPTCDAADDAFNGFTVLLRTGSCGALVDDASLELMLEPWAVHTVNHQSYGTFLVRFHPRRSRPGWSSCQRRPRPHAANGL